VSPGPFERDVDGGCGYRARTSIRLTHHRTVGTEGQSELDRPQTQNDIVIEENGPSQHVHELEASRQRSLTFNTKDVKMASEPYRKF